MFQKLKRCSCKVKNDYSKRVEEYVKKEGIKAIKRLYSLKYLEGLSSEKIIIVLGEDYPKAPWIDEGNITGQFICMLKQIGYDYAYEENGKVYLDIAGIYNQVVSNHLKLSGREILYALSDCCEKTQGRISYEQMKEILGKHYPRPLKSTNIDERVSIIVFLKEAGILFNFDEKHVYLP